MSITVHIQIDEEYNSLFEPSIIVAAAEATLQHCAVMDGILTIVLTNDESVQELNRTYRGVDAPTDVLSFATHDTAPPPPEEGMADDSWEEPSMDSVALPTEIADELAHYLGDIIIAYPYAEQQAIAYQNDLSAELRLLTVHGVLHLLGYDHHTPEEESEMWQMQRQILAKFGDAALTDRIYQQDSHHD